MSSVQEIFAISCPHEIVFGGYGGFELTFIDFEKKTFIISKLEGIPGTRRKRIFRSFCCASGVASFISRKKVGDVHEIYGDEYECQKMLALQSCRKLDKEKNRVSIPWNERNTGYTTQEDWNTWFVPRKANLIDIFDGNFVWKST